MVNGRLPNDGGTKADGAQCEQRIRSVRGHASQCDGAFAMRADGKCALSQQISLTMKIVQILGKVAENLPLTCAKSTAQNEPRLQRALLASPQPR
jgi:hypothetical protein